jgi:carbamoyltransferase
MKHSYFGPSFSNEEIENELIKNKVLFKKSKIKYKRINNFNYLCKLVSKKISSGKIVGWYQDRMEWGPRALGNRSILCDPRNKKIRDILNVKIKKREKFRPFAPSILREKVKEWFEVDDENPFMTKVYKIKVSKKKIIPAVCHIDGTGRVQTVRKINNIKYYMLIKEFFKLSGVPILLNTSFNESEPIVCTPKNALDCFIRTKMDIIVLQNWILYR